jgi:hypothetical protein
MIISLFSGKFALILGKPISGRKCLDIGKKDWSKGMPGQEQFPRLLDQGSRLQPFEIQPDHFTAADYSNS